MSRRRKGFEFGEGNFYFTIKTSPRNITIHRKDKNEALRMYNYYASNGKDIEWLGMWDGKQFVDEKK